MTKGELTRAAILEAAIARFGRDGYRAASVADIARDAGVGGTVAYAYFDNKEALFLAALDEDAAAVVHEGLPSVLERLGSDDWRQSLVLSLVAALEHHPLARRTLAGLEPEVTERVLDIPVMVELRRAVCERLRAEQHEGTVRADVDPDALGNGMVTIVLALLRSVVQLGTATTERYAGDVMSVFAAALDPLPAPALSPGA